MAGVSLADFDPTSSGSAFGGLVRQGIGAVGGSGILGQVDAGLARKRASGSTGTVPPPVLPAGLPRWAIYAGAGVAAALVLYLVLRK